MIRNKTSWMKPLMAAALIALPFLVTGCGGGGGSSNLNPTNPTASLGRLNAQFSQPVGEVRLPATATYTAEQSFMSLFPDVGNYTLRPAFGNYENDPVSLRLFMEKMGRIESGDSFALTYLQDNLGESGMLVHHTATVNGKPVAEDLRARSGTFTVTSLVYTPNTDPEKSTANLKFKVTNAVLRNANDSRGITFNGTGEITLRTQGIPTE